MLVVGVVFGIRELVDGVVCVLEVDVVKYGDVFVGVVVDVVVVFVVCVDVGDVECVGWSLVVDVVEYVVWYDCEVSC